MKFELKPYNYGLSDSELIDDLRVVAQRLRKDYVTKEEYDEHGRLCSATFKKRFGSWGKAHELAGLKRIRNFQATAEDCIVDLRKVAEFLHTDCISTSDYKIHGQYSVSLIAKRTGSWKKAVAAAGLRLSAQYHETILEEALFENLEQLWERLGRQPKTGDFVRPLSHYSVDTYKRRYGTLRKALEAFVESFSPGQLSGVLSDHRSQPSIEMDAMSAESIHKTSRSVSWRTRFLVMRRDNFKCQLCGVSPANQPGTVLVVDHIKPWAAGGETVMENLQTLCEPCNAGKSDLSLDDK